jgi:hypothetical protein
MNKTAKCPLWRRDAGPCVRVPLPGLPVEMNVAGGTTLDSGLIPGTGTGSSRPSPLSVEEVARLFSEMLIHSPL